MRMSEKRVSKRAFVPKGQGVTGGRKNCNEEAHILQILGVS